MRMSGVHAGSGRKFRRKFIQGSLEVKLPTFGKMQAGLFEEQEEPEEPGERERERESQKKEGHLVEEKS